MDISLIKPWEVVKDSGAWHAAVHSVIKSQTQLKRLNNKCVHVNSNLPVYHSSSPDPYIYFF